MGQDLAPLSSACVFCGSSDDADPQLLADAAQLGRELAAAKLKLIYGGGGVGLMGACAVAAHEAGGEVLGVIPNFLKVRERRLDVVETIVVSSMHERKQIMFDHSDSFIVLPGASAPWRKSSSCCPGAGWTCTPSRWCSTAPAASGSRSTSSSSTPWTPG